MATIETGEIIEYIRQVFGVVLAECEELEIPDKTGAITMSHNEASFFLAGYTTCMADILNFIEKQEKVDK